MAKREPLRIPLDFDQVMGDLLKVKPPMKTVKHATTGRPKKKKARPPK